MNWEEYKECVLEDAQEIITDEFENYYDFQDLFNVLRDEDSVTGNGSGSYYFNAYRAEEEIAGVVFDYEVNSEIKEYGYEDGLPVKKGAEFCDVLVRLLALEAQYSELEEYYDELIAEKEEKD